MLWSSAEGNGLNEEVTGSNLLFRQQNCSRLRAVVSNSSSLDNMKQSVLCTQDACTGECTLQWKNLVFVRKNL